MLCAKIKTEAINPPKGLAASIFLFLLLLMPLCSPVSAESNKAETPTSTTAPEAYSKTEVNALLSIQQATLKRQEENLKRAEEKLQDHDATIKSFEEKVEYAKRWMGKEETSIDRWLTLVTVSIGLVGLLGIIFPILFPILYNRNLREEYRRTLEDIKKQHDEVSTYHQEIAELRQTANDGVLSIKDSLNSANETKQKLEEIQEELQKGGPLKALEKKKFVDDIAKNKSASVENQLFALAIQAQEQSDWEKAISLWTSLKELSPENPKILFGLGYSLAVQAGLKEGDEAANLYSQACEKYAAVHKIAPYDNSALNNWGNALTTYARLRAEEGEGEEAASLYSQAYEKYEAADKISPDNDALLTNWGHALSTHAKLRAGEGEREEATSLYSQACEKYEAAHKIAPDDSSVLNNLGATLVALARLGAAEDTEPFYVQALRLYDKIDGLVPGKAAYNKACLASLKGDFDECRCLLHKSKEAGRLPSLDHIETDSDLDPVRNEEWYKDFIIALENNF